MKKMQQAGRISDPDFSATDSKPASKRSNKLLRLIALFKFGEAAVVVAAGLASLRLLDPATLDALSAWTRALPALAEQQFAQRLLDHLSGVSPKQIKALGAGAFLFASIFLAEGIGLWLEKRWAEWLSVVATALFIPLEVLELFRHASASKVIALVLNSLVVVYLLIRILIHKKGAGEEVDSEKGKYPATQ